MVFDIAFAMLIPSRSFAEELRSPAFFARLSLGVNLLFVASNQPRHAKTKKPPLRTAFSFWLRGRICLRHCVRNAYSFAFIRGETPLTGVLRPPFTWREPTFRSFKSAASCKNKKPPLRTAFSFWLRGRI